MALITVLVMVVLAASPALSALTGEPCQDDRDCAYAQQECIKRFDECEKKGCFCKPDYGGRFAQYCRRMLGASDRCYNRAHSVGCPTDTHCDSTKDTCVASNIKAGSPCTNTYDSLPCTSGASCSGSACKCSSNYKTVAGRCVKIPFGDACVVGVSTCDVNYVCLGASPTCQCYNNTYTKQTGKQDDSDVTACIHADASTDVAVGGACRINDPENTGKICKSGLTCSKCLPEDAPTCITPGGGADGVKAGFVILSAALLLTKLM